VRYLGVAVLNAALSLLGSVKSEHISESARSALIQWYLPQIFGAGQPAPGKSSR